MNGLYCQHSGYQTCCYLVDHRSQTARPQLNSWGSYGVKPDAKVADLSEDQLEALRGEITKLDVEGDLRREISMNIKRLMDLGCYRGLRRLCRVVSRPDECSTRRSRKPIRK